MKATGIVRRVDELGRIVIPKEIRKSLRMKEGSPLEIYITDKEEIVFKKYSPLKELSSYSTEAVEAIFESLEYPVMLIDKDEVLQVAGITKSEYINKPISAELENLILERKNILKNKAENATLCTLLKGGSNDYSAQIIVPINAGGDVLGGFVLFSKEENTSFNEMHVKVLSVLANFLAKELE